jgi:3,4-dihydroxy 2-butanone 4-phosphate synthase / GTP cyclohydrolase II
VATPFDSIEDALADLRRGRMVVVCDDEDRENEGDLVIAAEFATAESINFLITHGRGLVCLALTEERCDDLGLPRMAGEGGDSYGTAFTVSVDARHGVTTGISPADRARTIQVALDPATKPGDLNHAGHMFPLRARRGGVLSRRGHTEASVDLARLAGLFPASVICEVVNDDGSMARVPDLVGFCARWDLKMVTIADLAAYRETLDPLVDRVVETRLPTASGMFTAAGYRSVSDGREHLALVRGPVPQPDDALAIVARYCGTGLVFGSSLCDCRDRLNDALLALEHHGTGVLVLLGRGPCDGSLLGNLTPDHSTSADLRSPQDDGVAAAILADLGLSGVPLRGPGSDVRAPDRSGATVPPPAHCPPRTSSDSEPLGQGRETNPKEGRGWSLGIGHADWTGERAWASVD